MVMNLFPRKLEEPGRVPPVGSRSWAGCDGGDWGGPNGGLRLFLSRFACALARGGGPGHVNGLRTSTQLTAQLQAGAKNAQGNIGLNNYTTVMLELEYLGKREYIRHNLAATAW